jgi:transcriptional regulator with XRE-family HTH domain
MAPRTSIDLPFTPDQVRDGSARHVDTLQELMIGARHVLGLSQKDFAERLNVSPQYVCDLEHGRRLGSVQHVDAICDLIGARPTMRIAWHQAGARAHGWKI